MINSDVLGIICEYLKITLISCNTEYGDLKCVTVFEPTDENTSKCESCNTTKAKEPYICKVKLI
jgi:hypothetical protein